MRRLINILIAMQLVGILADNTSLFAQDPFYFSRDIRYNAKIKPFCNNSPNSDFAPFVWNDIIFVTSSRMTSKNKKNIDKLTGKPFLSVYAFRMNCVLHDMKALPSSVNGNLNCGPIAVSRDTSLVVITKNYVKANKNQVQNLYLAYYVKENKSWSKEKLFLYNNIDYSLQHPYYDDKSRTLYFSSNVPGGYGRFDLYKSKWDGTNWSTPENLGPNINSLYNEVFPCLTPSGDLMYTSDHAGNYGGLDIILYRDKTRYLLPQPINTKYDDFSVSFVDKSSGYFATNRDTVRRNDDVYSFALKADSISFLIRVIDNETQIPVPGVTVTVTADNPRIEDHLITSSQGEGVVYMGPVDSIYASFELTKEGYLPLKTYSGNFRNEADYRIMTLRMDKVPPPEDTLIVIGIREKFDYYVIVNSFQNIENARKFANWMKKDYGARVTILPLTEDGYSRVSIGKFTEIEDALPVLREARSKVNPDTWIFADKRKDQE
jgi:hypothetical protein